MTNVEGVYDDQKKLISEIKPFDLENLLSGRLFKWHDSKIQNCVDAVENGVRGVILDGRNLIQFLHEIFSTKVLGL